MQPRKSTINKVFSVGYTAKGIVYFIMGLFAIATVIGVAKSTNGPKAVIDWIGTNPFGQVFTFVIGIGLLAYCSWRWFRAIRDPGNDADGKSGALKRIGWAFSGTAYGVLSFYAFKNIFGGGSGGGGTDKQDVIQYLLQQGWGPAVVIAIGVIVAGVGAYQLFRGVTDRHMEGVSGGLSDGKQKLYRRTGRAGLAARAVVYGIIAYFLFRAGMMDDASQFGGVSDALTQLRDYPQGAVLLAIVGAGLLAYGLFMLVRARYEKVLQ